MKKGLLLFLVLRIVMGTTVWAQETPSPEMTAFEKKVVEELPEWHFPSFVSEGEAKRISRSQTGEIRNKKALTAKPYINQDGVLMVAAEDLGEFLGFGKTRKETYWDENGKRIDVIVENSVAWDEDAKKITIEVPWHVAGYYWPTLCTIRWDPLEEGDVLELWEPTSKGYDGQVRKHRKYEIAMTVDSNVWSFDKGRYVSRTKCEWKNGRVYLPLKDIHQTMFPKTIYRWDAETRTLALVEGIRE